jgi:predicted Rossmann-fold nucleotide-binding protein
MRRLAVFLAASNGHNPAHAAVAASVGTELARQGIGLVYGGGRRGLMGVMADSALKAGGEVIGVMPRSMVEREWAHEGVTELLMCDSMHERRRSWPSVPTPSSPCPAVSAPWKRSLRCGPGASSDSKPIGFLNAGGFWTPLLGALRDIAGSGFLPASTLDDLAVAPDLPGLLEALQERLRSIPQPAHGENLR